MWALMDDPDFNIMVISYSDELTQSRGREMRRIVNEHADYLGYSIAAHKSSVGRWAVEGWRDGCWPGESIPALPDLVPTCSSLTTR